MATSTTPATPAAARTRRTRRAGGAERPRRPVRSGIRGREGAAAAVFLAPALFILVVFLVVPIGLALYVSLTKWDGLSSPFGGGAKFVGLGNYETLLHGDSLVRQNFATAVRNNFSFVLLVVPIQTILALWLAVLLNNRWLRGRGFFRTAFYFPSITSSIAITLVFLFLFSGSGPVNALLKAVGIDGPDWMTDSNGIVHNLLGLVGVHSAPGWAQHEIFNLSVWDWLSGPSVAMCVIIILVIWTTSGTFMLMFLAALQNIGEEIDDATAIDGTTAWQRFRYVTVPMLRPTTYLVVTLGLIGTWQVFDQIYLTGNNPATVTPAYLSFSQSFNNQAFGIGAAIAFLLFLLIIALAALQRRLMGADD